MADRTARPSRWRAARRTVGFAWEADRARSVLTMVLFTLQAAVVSAFAWWLKLLVDAVPAGHTPAVAGASLALAATIAASVGLDYACSRVRMALSDRARHLMDRRLLRLVGGTPTLVIHETPEHLAQLELLEDESWQFGAVVPAIVDAVSNALRMVIAIALLAAVDPLLLLLPVFGVPGLLLSSKTSGLFVLGAELTTEQTRRAEALFDLATTSGPAKEIRLFRLQTELLRRFAREHDQIRRVRMRLAVRGELVRVTARSVFVLGYIAAIGYVAWRAVDGAVSTGDVVLTAVLAGQVLGLVAGYAELTQWTLQTLATMGRFLHLERVAEAELDRTGAESAAPARLRDGIRISGMSFRHSGSDVDVLSDIDLMLPAGATIAVVGENGAGKTTLVKLLAGMYRPSSGQITVDGEDLAELDPVRWRARLSAGFQDFARFELLARETVGIGDLAALDDAAAVTRALARAGGSDVLEALPRGLDTQLGPSWPGGVDLSGGQWQKLALGRAMMRTSPLLLLLDEPTAALDAETEHRLFERWTAAAMAAREASGAITVLVSHRFSTVRRADLIVVLDRGRVLEVGTHAELMALHGLYAELFELQARTYR